MACHFEKPGPEVHHDDEFDVQHIGLPCDENQTQVGSEWHRLHRLSLLHRAVDEDDVGFQALNLPRMLAHYFGSRCRHHQDHDWSLVEVESIDRDLKLFAQAEECIHFDLELQLAAMNNTGLDQKLAREAEECIGFDFDFPLAVVECTVLELTLAVEDI